MCLEDRVLVYGDCAVVPRPTAGQLDEIAIVSAASAPTCPSKAPSSTALP